MPKIEVVNNKNVVSPSRIFVNSTQCILPSVNWKHDWWWFKKKSFAQVVKHNCTNTVVHKVKNVLKNGGKHNVPKATKMGDFDQKCRRNSTVKLPPTCVQNNATVVQNALVKQQCSNQPR